MSINKEAIMYKLYERDYLHKMHKKIKQCLIGSLKSEYLSLSHQTMEYQYLPVPQFSATVDMMASCLMHIVSQGLTNEVLEVIEEIEKGGEEDEHRHKKS